jgi:hypothetical protein
MHDKLFHAPVSVTIEGNVDCQISSLADMESFLQAWPEHRRRKLYRMAAAARENAAQGYITTDQARETLVSFARSVGALRDDLEATLTARGALPSYGGFAA